ncbi:P-loop NTPase fold protein [Bdellovibrio bacteriovorus]|uniref:P-loop NTPase fold protein n=1 Tax=Bdellovibrio TaxID=958 RepID=UPI0035A86DBC
MADLTQSKTEMLIKQIQSSLESSSQKIPGAILLEGPWGSGKTYFWKKEVEPMLGKSPIYVSLFGLPDIDSIQNRIISGAISKAKDEKTDFSKHIQSVVKFAQLTPKLGLKFISKFIENKTTVNPEELLETLDLSLNLLKIIPKGSVICLDDIERVKVPYDQLLGLVDRLLLECEARIALIANENSMKGISTDSSRESDFFKFKEKVVWKTLRWEPNFTHTIDGVCKDLVSLENLEKIENFKGAVLEAFTISKCKNLRALERSIKSLDEILSIKDLNLDPKYARYLCSLIIHQTESGTISDDAWVYGGNNYYLSMSINKKKEEDLTGKDKESAEFLARFYSKDTSQAVFSKAIHEFVYTGILNKVGMNEEFNPKIEVPYSRVLSQMLEFSWVYKPDEYGYWLVNDAEKNIIDYSVDINIHILFRIYRNLARLCDHLSIQMPNIDNAMKDRIRDHIRENSEDPRLESTFSTGLETNAMRPYLDYYRTARIEIIIEKKKDSIMENLKQGKNVNDDFHEIRDPNDLMSLILDEDILKIADELLYSYPEQHYQYYNLCIEKLKYYRDYDGSAQLEALSKRIDALSSTSKEIGLKKRMGWLKNKIESKD